MTFQRNLVWLGYDNTTDMKVEEVINLFHRQWLGTMYVDTSFQDCNRTVNPQCETDLESFTIIVTQENQTSLNKSASGGQQNVTFHDLKPYTSTVIEVIALMGNHSAYRNISSTSPEIGNYYFAVLQFSWRLKIMGLIIAEKEYLLIWHWRRVHDCA